MLTPEQVQFFRDNGFLKIPGALSPGEVQELRDATQALIDQGPTESMSPGERKDYQYGRVRGSDDKIMRRIEYLIGKGAPFVRLLANPVLLDAVQKIVGEQFVPTYDAMVIKMPGRGVEVPWHRDGDGYNNMYYDDPVTGHRFPAVNFDIYIDEATPKTGALWAIPGSNKETVNRTPELAKRGEYETVEGAILVEMQPGDLLIHDVMLYHGSPETQGAEQIRRVIYYEFRDMRFINALHRPGWPESWTNRRLALLQTALEQRQQINHDAPFPAHPIPQLRVPPAAPEATRVSHPGWDA